MTKITDEQVSFYIHGLIDKDINENGVDDDITDDLIRYIPGTEAGFTNVCSTGCAGVKEVSNAKSFALCMINGQTFRVTIKEIENV